MADYFRHNIADRSRLVKNVEERACANGQNMNCVRIARRPLRRDVTTRKTGVADRRVEKTEKALREAMHALIAEKPYDAIAVGDILDRANVGKSTFYTHYAGKDELLANSIRELVGAAHTSARSNAEERHERALWFSLPIFEYLHRQRHASAHRDAEHHANTTHGREMVHELLRGVLCEMITDAVRTDWVDPARGPAPASFLVRYVASTFILVLEWWLADVEPRSPQEADTVFRALVLPALAEFARS